MNTNPENKVINSTDATQHEPLAVRAQIRKAELEAALAKVDPNDQGPDRKNLELAIATVDGYLTGDLEHLTETTSSDISKWLENSKHLGEVAKAPKLKA